MSASRSWIAFVDDILTDLGAPAAYRVKAEADITALVALGCFERVPPEKAIRQTESAGEMKVTWRDGVPVKFIVVQEEK
jgi:hypothetical protein